MDEKLFEMDINKEFYKKLNQQIVQKDNLIRLLQKQIENLSSEPQGAGGVSEAERDEKVQHLNSTIADLREKLENLQHKASQAQPSALSETLSLDLQERDQEIDKLKAEINRLQDEIIAGNVGVGFDPAERQALERRIKELTDRNMELQSQAQESAMLSIENSRLKQRIEELEQPSEAESEKTAELESRIADLLVSEAECRAEISDLNETLDRLRSDCEALREERDNLRVTSEETIKSLHSMIDDLEARLRETASSDMETERLRSRVIDLEDQLENLRLHQAMEEVGDDSSEELKTTVEALESRLQELTQARQEAEKGIEEMAGLNEELSRRVAEQAAVIEEIRGKAEEEAYDKVSREKEGLLSQLQIMESRINETEQELHRERGLRERTETSLREALESGRIEESEGSRQAREEAENLRRKIKTLEEDLRRRGSASEGGSAAQGILEDIVDLHDTLAILKGREAEAFRSKIEAIFARNGILPISAVGYPFDAELHIIGEFVRSSDYDEGTVVEELKPGFRAGERVLRKTEVVVIQNRLVCPSCSTVGREGSNYCDKCGTKLVFPTISPDVAAPEEIREIGKVAAIYKNIGRSFEERGLFEKAEQQYCEALKVAPEDLDLLFRLASLYEIMGKYDESIGIYEKIRPLSMDKSRIEKVIHNLKTKLSIIDQIKKIRYDF